MLEPGMKKRAGAHKTAAALSVGISDMNLHIHIFYSTRVIISPTRSEASQA